MPVVLQTHPNHSSASTKRQLKRCRERRKVELLCLFWEWVFWAVCWRWVSISWNEFEWDSAEPLQDKYAHEQRPVKCSSAAGSLRAAPAADTGGGGDRGPSRGFSTLMLMGTTQRSFCCRGLFWAHVSFSICNGFRFLSLSGSSFSLVFIHINSL